MDSSSPFVFPKPEDIFRVPVGGPPPSVPERLPRVELRSDIFDRLRWSVLDSPLEVRVLEVGGENVPIWRPLFGNPDSSIADEAATVPPRSCLSVVIDPLHHWYHWQDAEAWDERPAPLSIKNVNGEPISVWQLINEVHAYALHLRDLLCECLAVYESQLQACFYYSSWGGSLDNPIERPDPCFSLEVITDSNGAWNMEEYWADIENRL